MPLAEGAAVARALDKILDIDIETDALMTLEVDMLLSLIEELAVIEAFMDTIEEGMKVLFDIMDDMDAMAEREAEAEGEGVITLMLAVPPPMVLYGVH